MMLPGMQCCPPYNLMPSIFGLESLVFWVEPPCFLEALHNRPSEIDGALDLQDECTQCNAAYHLI
jgi:hypothetical protein